MSNYMSNFNLLNHLVFNRLSFLRIIIIVVLIDVLMIPMVRVRADGTKPDPRFGIVESYQAPDIANEWEVGWDRVVIEWYRVQPLGPNSWIPVYPHGLEIVEQYGDQIYRNSIEHSLLQNEWFDTAAHNSRELAALLIGTPKWATKGLPHRGVPEGLYLPVSDPGNHWANFVRRIVFEYGDQIKHWIIWNEPDISFDHPGAQFDGSVEDYYRLVKVAYIVAKEVDPDAVIHLGGLTYWHDIVYGRESYLRRLLEVVTSDKDASSNNFYFDVATVHVYFNSESVYQIIKKQFDVLVEFGIDKAIWMNETNAAPMDDPQHPWYDPILPVTLEQQASFLIQSSTLAFAAGAERIAIYKLFDHVGPVMGLESYGLIRNDGSLRPASIAYQVLSENLSHFQTVNHSTWPTHQVITFLSPTRRTIVAWARTNNDMEAIVDPLLDTKGAFVIDQRGNTLPIFPVNGEYRLSLAGGYCDDARQCLVGGEPLLVMEYQQCDLDHLVPQQDCMLWVSTGTILTSS